MTIELDYSVIWSEICILNKKHFQMEYLKTEIKKTPNLNKSLDLIKLVNEIPEFHCQGFQVVTSNIVFDDIYKIRELPTSIILLMYGKSLSEIDCEDIAKVNPSILINLYAIRANKKVSLFIQDEKIIKSFCLIKELIRDILICDTKRCNYCTIKKYCKYTQWNGINKKLIEKESNFHKETIDNIGGICV